jgi:hypothetical protein
VSAELAGKILRQALILASKIQPGTPITLGAALVYIASERTSQTIPPSKKPSQSEIADCINRSTEAVQSAVRRAREKLKHALIKTENTHPHNHSCG